MDIRAFELKVDSSPIRIESSLIETTIQLFDNITLIIPKGIVTEISEKTIRLLHPNLNENLSLFTSYYIAPSQVERCPSPLNIDKEFTIPELPDSDLDSLDSFMEEDYIV